MTTEAASAPKAGDVLELTAGEVVHGGWCVSRQDDTGWVVFVRHALPGERVRAEVTQATARFARADAVEILRPSADRVPAPCRYARPGGCGGCDWQHASLTAQREFKAAVIRQQLSRIGGLDREVEVQAIDGDDGGLGWRTVVTFATDGNGRAGLHRHRSHEVVDIDRCLIAHPLVTAAGVTGMRWPRAKSVEVAAVPATGELGVLVFAAWRRCGWPAGRGGRLDPAGRPVRSPDPAAGPGLPNAACCRARLARQPRRILAGAPGRRGPAHPGRPDGADSAAWRHRA